MTDVEILEEAFKSAKAEADAAYKAMWAKKSDKTLVAAFEKAFKRQGDARRALEAATGKSQTEHSTSLFAQKKTLDHSAQIDREMDE